MAARRCARPGRPGSPRTAPLQRLQRRGPGTGRDTQGGQGRLDGEAGAASAAVQGGDEAIRAASADGSILAFAASGARLCEQARRRQDLWPTAAAATGRVLVATALLALPLKDGGVTVRVVGDGPLGGILAAATPEGDVRGYAVHGQVDLPPRPDGKLDVGGAVGRNGVLRVTRESALGRPYTGSAPLVSGEIAEDFASYFLRSEQVPSLVALGVLVGRGGRVRAAGGLIVQVLPGAAGGVAERLEANAQRIGAISRALDAGAAPRALVEAALQGFAPRVLERRPLRFRCRCGRRRLAGVLRGLPAADLRAMRVEDGGAEVVCHFCGRRYRFTAAELGAMEAYAEAQAGAPAGGAPG